MAYLIPFLLAFLTTFAVMPAVIRFAVCHNLVDDPRRRYHPAHVHTGIIPRAGGIALFIGLLTGIWLIIGFNKMTAGILCGCLILTIVGILDDKQDIHPYIRILTNSLAIIIVIASGIGVPFITNPLSGGIIPMDQWKLSFEFFGTHSILILADIFAFIWLSWTTNIIGWSAGVDGQMPGFVAITATVLGLLSLRYDTGHSALYIPAVLSFIVAGIFTGFTPWNFYPQKIMPGYGGKTLAGFLLGILGIVSYAKVGTALLVLGIPTVDALYTVLRRIRKGQSPMLADREHLHHTLLKLGWGKRRIALFYWLVSAILGTVALTVTSKEKVFTLLFVAVIFAGFLLWVQFFTQLSRPRDPDNG